MHDQQEQIEKVAKRNEAKQLRDCRKEALILAFGEENLEFRDQDFDRFLVAIKTLTGFNIEMLIDSKGNILEYKTREKRGTTFKLVNENMI